MPEILIISGKGGTGKTSLTAAFAQIAGNAVICDLDVDAPDLHLLLKPDIKRTEDFISGNEAVIDYDRCCGCCLCAEICLYDAIDNTSEGPVLDPLKCEGCKVCVHFCPGEAIDFPARHCGRWHLSETRFGPMVHAQLFPGQENSGKLVALLRQQAKGLAKQRGSELILCDGTPGIGCPVISSLTGTDVAVAVTEPTPSGLHDLSRVVELCEHFTVPVMVIINKCDLNQVQAKRVEEFCDQRGIAMLAQIPYDPSVVEALVQGRTIVEYDEQGPVAKTLKRAWQEIIEKATAAKAA